ncbi:MAG: hypothetical protein HY344_01190 [Candidatus Levybacteria bacterium]|nr:hypothetical protein [Candidatus Levybacteria bacterium]
MLETPGPTIDELSLNPEVFAAHFPSGTITEISPEVLPDSLIQTIKHKKGSVAFAISYADGSKTLGVTGGFGGKIHIEDFDKNDRPTGNGNIQPDHIDEIGLPIIGFSSTAKKLRRKGLGRQRLLVMNALSHMFFGMPLRSSSYQELPPHLAIWERLEREGKAEKYPGLKMTRYRFTI